MILVDTSVWIEHLRAGNDRLAHLLETEQVVMHPFVLGELALGNFRGGRGVLTILGELPQLTVPDLDEVLHFIEANRLYGRGIGYVDAHLLAAVRITPGTRLWALDRPLKEIASSFDLDAKLTS